MLRTLGGVFCGRYAIVTLSSEGAAAALPENSARHWMYLALGLVIPARSGSVSGADQSLHVASGRSEFPLRVLNAMPFASPLHDSRPHRATVEESCTGDSNHPLGTFPVSSRKSFPKFPVAASSAPRDSSSRVASPSFDCATSVAFRSRSKRYKRPCT